MKPLDIQPIGNELAIRWEDGTEQFLPLEQLRRHCPCAGCKGETDILGNVYKNPARALGPSAFQLRGLTRIGTYGIQPTWGDGHASGIFSFDYVKSISNQE